MHKNHSILTGNDSLMPPLIFGIRNGERRALPVNSSRLLSPATRSQYSSNFPPPSHHPPMSAILNIQRNHFVFSFPSLLFFLSFFFLGLKPFYWKHLRCPFLKQSTPNQFEFLVVKISGINILYVNQTIFPSANCWSRMHLLHHFHWHRQQLYCIFIEFFFFPTLIVEYIFRKKNVNFF